MSSEKTHSKTLEVKKFEKFGFKFEYGAVTEYHPKWVQVMRSSTGEDITQVVADSRATYEQLNGHTVNYEDTHELCASMYVEYARITDPSFEGRVSAPIEVWGTLEGPLMGIRNPEPAIDPSRATLLDPCLIMYDGKSKINLMPIFNVARELTIRMDAIRTITPPNEILLALYPGFLIQNRMAAYQLKPSAPLVVSPVLTNDAELSK